MSEVPLYGMEYDKVPTRKSGLGESCAQSSEVTHAKEARTKIGSWRSVQLLRRNVKRF
jgi:hypothetical protein